MCPYGRYELGARAEIAEKNVIRLNNYFYVVLIVYELSQKTDTHNHHSVKN